MFVFSRFTRYFDEVARLGSIRKASERLNVSASAIDRQILRVEEELGVALFERLPTGLRPTAAGELLLTSTRRWRQEFERLQIQISDLLGLRRGHVRIAVIDALSKGFVSRQIQALRQEFPDITFELKVLDNVNVLASVADGDVDFGLMLNPQSSKDIAIRAHREVFLGFVVPPEHGFASLASCRFSQCLGHAMVVPAQPLALCEQVQALEATSGIRMSVAAASDNIQMMKSLITDGVGIGVLSLLDVMEEVRAGELAFVRISDVMLKPLTLALCVAQARQLSVAANLLLTRMDQELSRAEL
jgi:DNA-binding transcriptional LysR family regulator